MYDRWHWRRGGRRAGLAEPAQSLGRRPADPHLIHIYIYIYIYIERDIYIYTHIYAIHICIYIYIYREREIYE